MLAALRKRIDRDEEGFTLIELMVVVLIIAILIAIAIPTFLGAQDRARDRAAQSNLRNALTAAKTQATDHEGFFLKDSGPTAMDNTDMDLLEPALAPFIAAAGTPGVGKVAVKAVGAGANVGEGIILWTISASDTWFGIASDKNGKVTYCKGAAAAAVSTYTIGSSGPPVVAPTGCTLSKWS